MSVTSACLVPSVGWGKRVSLWRFSKHISKKKEYLESLRIMTPQQNEVAERKNWKTLEVARAMNMPACSVPSVKRGGRVFLWCFQSIAPKRRNALRFYVLWHTVTKWSSWKEESENTWGSKGHDEREAYAEVILAWSSIYGHLLDESVHNIWCKGSHSTWEILWKENEPIPFKVIRCRCRCAEMCMCGPVR